MGFEGFVASGCRGHGLGLGAVAGAASRRRWSRRAGMADEVGGGARLRECATKPFRRAARSRLVTGRIGLGLRGDPYPTAQKTNIFFQWKSVIKKSELEGRKENEITGPSAERREAASR